MRSFFTLCILSPFPGLGSAPGGLDVLWSSLCQEFQADPGNCSRAGRRDPPHSQNPSRDDLEHFAEWTLPFPMSQWWFGAVCRFMGSVCPLLLLCCVLGWGWGSLPLELFRAVFGARVHPQLSWRNLHGNRAASQLLSCWEQQPWLMFAFISSPAQLWELELWFWGAASPGVWIQSLGCSGSLGIGFLVCIKERALASTHWWWEGANEGLGLEFHFSHLISWFGIFHRKGKVWGGKWFQGYPGLWEGIPAIPRAAPGPQECPCPGSLPVQTSLGWGCSGLCWEALQGSAPLWLNLSN